MLVESQMLQSDIWCMGQEEFLIALDIGRIIAWGNGIGKLTAVIRDSELPPPHARDSLFFKKPSPRK
jgi:hypothetical protein